MGEILLNNANTHQYHAWILFPIGPYTEEHLANMYPLDPNNDYGFYYKLANGYIYTVLFEVQGHSQLDYSRVEADGEWGSILNLKLLLYRLI